MRIEIGDGRSKPPIAQDSAQRKRLDERLLTPPFLFEHLSWRQIPEQKQDPPAIRQQARRQRNVEQDLDKDGAGHQDEERRQT